MSLFAFDMDRDLRAITEMVERLKPYVYEDELYGLMPADLPKLTVGGLLMRLKRLLALQDSLSASQQQTLKNAQQNFQQIRDEWRVAYEGKVEWEIRARITSLEQFLNECTENLRACAENFPSAMEKRVILENLKDEAEFLGTLSEATTTRLTQLDNSIRRYVEDGSFIWESRLEKVYPRDKYWFLYAYVPKIKK